ncbi:MAG: VirB3 family type IV secretion system protein [Beijerinckiaceae bacterium]
MESFRDSDDDKRIVHPVVVGLTRPTTMWGVPLPWFGITFGIPAALFVGLEDVLMWFWALPIYGLGYVLTVYDNRLIDIVFLKLRLIRLSPIRRHWGGNTYRI